MRIASAAAAGGRSKWAAMAASTWIQCVVGGSYCFGVYSPVLKSSQGYDQSTLDSVAFFKDVGANVGVLSGLLISSPVVCGRTWVVHLAGAVQCLAGYAAMWLAVAGFVPRLPPALMCLFMLLAAHAQTFFNTANVVTAVENFPDSRGTAIGIMKGFLGLSGAILIQIYRTMFDSKPSSFILMLALLPTLLTLLLMPFVKIHRGNGPSEKKFLDAFSLIALVVAGYLMLVIIGESIARLGLVAHILTFAALLVMLLSPVAVVIKAQMIESKMAEEGSSHERTRFMDDESEDSESTSVEHDPRVPYDGQFSQNMIMLQRGENFNLVQAMSTIDFWLLFLAMACGMGSGLATVNNISQIGGSLGYSIAETSILVSLWSIWNFLGRFGSGYISDYFLRRNGWPRPVFIALTLTVMSVGHAVISSGLPGSLYIGSVLVGICYGSQWALMPSITSELFGLRHFGTIFNTIAIASPFGSYILSVRIVGYIYDLESAGARECSGRHCFKLSFLIMASVSLFGAVAASALFCRTRRFYEQVIYAKLQTSLLQ